MNLKRILYILSTALTLAISPTTIASAQDTPDEIVQYLPGIESAYARKYISAHELGVHIAGTPVASPEAESANFISATVLEFKDEISLTTVWATMLNNDMIATIAGDSDADFKVTRVDDLGDQAIVALAEDSDGESTGVVIVQDGNLGYILLGEGLEGPLMQTMRDIAYFMVDAEPGTGEVTIGETANSTGGTFDLLPSASDTDVIGALVPMYDYDLLIGNDSPLQLDRPRPSDNDDRTR